MSSIVITNTGKPFYCSECKNPVLKGHKYQQEMPKIDGKVADWSVCDAKICMSCARRKDKV